jgi:hypothetical protein
LLGLCSLPLLSGRATAITMASIEALKPGEFIWHPSLSPEGPVVVVVSIPLQLVHVYRNGLVIAVSTCSTGKPGHRTPTGVFTILQKRREHYSSTYNNAPMPNMQRLTWQGIALHAGQLPGYPASHGCIRLPHDFSRLLFSITGLGTSVIVADHTSAHKNVVQPSMVLPKDVSATAKSATETAPAVQQSKKKATAAQSYASILVSGQDRKAYLLVNGEVTLTTPISIFNEQTPLGTHLYSLVGPSDGGHFLQWNSFDLGGDPASSTTVDLWSDPVLARIDYPDGPGVRAVARSLRPGTTMVITDDSAGPETRTAPGFTVIAEDPSVPGMQLRD